MARTEGQWQKGINLITPSEDVPILLRNSYLNFGGSVIGESGYGFRDNAGVMEFKNSGGSWTGIGTGGGGGGFTELTATGDANGTNVTYTFTQLPSYIVADGVWYKPTAKNGTAFWTNVGLTVTMVNPPAYDIFGVA